MKFVKRLQASLVQLLVVLEWCTGQSDSGLTERGRERQRQTERQRAGGPCLLQPSTQYESSETLGEPQPLQPDGCCAACAANPECQSWTVFDSQQSTQCTLFATAGPEQREHAKTGDVRYTSGFLPAREHPSEGGGRHPFFVCLSVSVCLCVCGINGVGLRPAGDDG